jgi:hypothetical protein
MSSRWQQCQERTLPGRKLASCTPPPKSLFEHLDRFSRHFGKFGRERGEQPCPAPPLLRYEPMNLHQPRLFRLLSARVPRLPPRRSALLCACGDPCKGASLQASFSVPPPEHLSQKTNPLHRCYVTAGLSFQVASENAGLYEEFDALDLVTTTAHSLLGMSRNDATADCTTFTRPIATIMPEGARAPREVQVPASKQEREAAGFVRGAWPENRTGYFEHW